MSAIQSANSPGAAIVCGNDDVPHGRTLPWEQVKLDAAETLTEEQKSLILEAYRESLHDEGTNAFDAVNKIRTAHNL